MFARVTGRLEAAGVVSRVEALIGAAGDDDAVEIEGLDGLTGFAAIRADPGGVSLKAMLAEIEKLLAVRAVGLSLESYSRLAIADDHTTTSSTNSPSKNGPAGRLGRYLAPPDSFLTSGPTSTRHVDPLPGQFPAWARYWRQRYGLRGAHTAVASSARGSVAGSCRALSGVGF